MDPLSGHYRAPASAPAPANAGTAPRATATSTAALGGGGGAGDAAAGQQQLIAALEFTISIVLRLRQAIEALRAEGSSSVVVAGGGLQPTSATSRISAVPDVLPGQTEQLRMARGQVTWREIPVTGAAGGTTITPPANQAGLGVEMYALRDFARGAYRTQVLEPVTGPVTVAAGETVRLVTRITASTPGEHAVDVAGARIAVHVGTRSIDALPMMAWINESNARERGASPESVGSVLAHFGVAASGNSGIISTSGTNPTTVQYFSAAWEGATRQSPADTARRIVEAEQRAAAASPGATFWVQVSDEQDATAAQVAGTVEWITQLRAHLRALGSDAKLFVAAQARPHNLAYATVIDGWATTQSAAGRDRDTAIADIHAAAARNGRRIELLEYPGNAFFDAGTPGSAAVSTASAALDGASSWFVYSANNHDVLERGGGDEGRGDIGGLVAIDGGRVLPTIALMEVELGANLGAAARSMGATSTSGAAQVAWTSDQLDAYRHTGAAPDLRAWEAQIGQLVD